MTYWRDAVRSQKGRVECHYPKACEFCGFNFFIKQAYNSPFLCKFAKYNTKEEKYENEVYGIKRTTVACFYI